MVFLIILDMFRKVDFYLSFLTLVPGFICNNHIHGSSLFLPTTDIFVFILATLKNNNTVSFFFFLHELSNSSRVRLI